MRAERIARRVCARLHAGAESEREEGRTRVQDVAARDERGARLQRRREALGRRRVDGALGGVAGELLVGGVARLLGQQAVLRVEDPKDRACKL